MNIQKQDLPKSQIELTVELSVEEFKPYIERGAEAVSKDVKIEGFRPGKVPYEVLKSKIGEMAILEEAANIAIRKTLDEAIKEKMDGKEPVGQPQVNITKLAPGNPFEYKVVMSVIPEITLPDFKTISVETRRGASVQPEDVEKMIEQLRDMRVKEAIVDREAIEGDKTVIDIQMFMDNVPVEGGQGKGTAVIIGKDFVVPGFDKQLVGMKKAEVREFKLRYPDDHYMKNLAGKIVEFKVTMNEIYSRELPEVNDEFAFGFGLKHTEELRDNIKKSMEEEKKQIEEQKTEIEMLDKLIKASKFGDIPEMLIEHEGQTMLNEIKHEIEHKGGKFEDYLQSINKTSDQMLLDFLPDAVKRVKSALLIREIALREKITVSEKEIDEKVEELVKQYKGYQKVEDRVTSPDYRHYLRNQIANRKVILMLKEKIIKN